MRYPKENIDEFRRQFAYLVENEPPIPIVSTFPARNLTRRYRGRPAERGVGCCRIGPIA